LSEKISRGTDSSAIVKKLERYRHRWEKLQAAGSNNERTNQPGPALFEFVYHNLTGRLLTLYDSLVGRI